MRPVGHDTLKTRSYLDVNGKKYAYYNLKKAETHLGDLSQLPFSLKIILENLLRFEDGRSVTVKDITAIQKWLKTRESKAEIAYRPARVLMQDFTGVPAVVDLAAMREAVQKTGGDPKKINPITQVDLVIDHSVMVDEYGTPKAFKTNVTREFERNYERYAFLKWGQDAFENFRVTPPGTGICHQVNLEHLAKTIWSETDQNGEMVAFPDTLVGTDSHTTMVNGLAVLGWGVGGIEAEAALLGQPISMLIPEVIGVKLTGKMTAGTTATDLVLTIVEALREKGVVAKFVEFYGEGLNHLSLADRATISNMAPEYGATCGFFPIDRETIHYLTLTGRSAEITDLVETYAKAQGMWRDENNAMEPRFTDSISIDLGSIVPCISGPKRPQDRIALDHAQAQFSKDIIDVFSEAETHEGAKVANSDFYLHQGDIVIAAITSCTNTSNPSVMIGAGLLARKALARGLTTKPWVKTSLAPGSQVVTDYLEKAKLQDALDQLGFNLVGYGCTTCIGNSGPLSQNITETIQKNNLLVCSVLSGNRNFEGRINPLSKANYLASPPLVVAYALAGTMKFNFDKTPLGNDPSGNPVFLCDIWPSNEEINALMHDSVNKDMFEKRYADVFRGPDEWRAVETVKSLTYHWEPKSTYIKNPPLFDQKKAKAIEDIKEANTLLLLGDSVTTDHISPAGAIMKHSAAGKYLTSHGVEQRDFNSYGSRRGNHEVMMRGTFANIRIRNQMLKDIEGGFTRHIPSGEEMAIYDASMLYQDAGTPLIVIAGKEYGTGSSRDWAAKGTKLLGIQAVIAESFERIHRSNLVGMGVLPLQFEQGITRKSLNLTGNERFDILGLSGKDLKPRMPLTLRIHRTDEPTQDVPLVCRIDTLDEVDYYKEDGILHYVLKKIAG